MNKTQITINTWLFCSSCLVPLKPFIDATRNGVAWALCFRKEVGYIPPLLPPPSPHPTPKPPTVLGFKDFWESENSHIFHSCSSRGYSFGQTWQTSWIQWDKERFWGGERAREERRIESEGMGHCSIVERGCAWLEMVREESVTGGEFRRMWSSCVEGLALRKATPFWMERKGLWWFYGKVKEEFISTMEN